MKEVLGCGIDIEELNRFKKYIPTRENISGFAESVYTRTEISTNLHIYPCITFPLCFSCKEALFKAFGLSWTNSRISWKDIELLFASKDNLQDYSIHLHGYAKELYSQMNCSSIESSFEYNIKYVIFQVVLLS